jgi:hypothetical protein
MNDLVIGTEAASREKNDAVIGIVYIDIEE